MFDKVNKKKRCEMCGLEPTTLWDQESHALPTELFMICLFVYCAHRNVVSIQTFNINNIFLYPGLNPRPSCCKSSILATRSQGIRSRCIYVHRVKKW